MPKIPPPLPLHLSAVSTLLPPLDMVYLEDNSDAGIGMLRKGGLLIQFEQGWWASDTDVLFEREVGIWSLIRVARFLRMLRGERFGKAFQRVNLLCLHHISSPNRG